MIGKFSSTLIVEILASMDFDASELPRLWLVLRLSVFKKSSYRVKNIKYFLQLHNFHQFSSLLTEISLIFLYLRVTLVTWVCLVKNLLEIEEVCKNMGYN